MKKKIWAKFQRIIELFTQKVVTTLSFQKYEFGIRDPRFGIRNKPILDPGSRGQNIHTIQGTIKDGRDVYPRGKQL